MSPGKTLQQIEAELGPPVITDTGFKTRILLNEWLSAKGIPLHKIRGSGKTTAAENVAKLMKLPFYFNGSVDTEYEGSRSDSEGETVIGWRINTSPLDLASACYSLTSAGFTRNLVYSIAGHYSDGRIAWPIGKYSITGSEEDVYYRLLKRKLGGDDKSLLLPPMKHIDPILANPVAWVNAQIARYNSTEN